MRLPVGSPQEVARVNALLVSAGVPVYRLGPERASLEETFLRLTGESPAGAGREGDLDRVGAEVAA
jgi:hypothetical protein